MSDTESALIHKVRQWAQYADEDLRLARHALSLTTGCPDRLIAYHAEQCAEKCLKAFLVLCGVDFPYTHNVGHLLDLCSAHAGWAETLRDAEELTPFAITARYPGQDEEGAQAEALQAIETAELVREAVHDAVRSKGIALPLSDPIV